jgi:mannitol-1-phosphate/altronate dehydrogenase
VTMHHTPKDLNLQQHCCENLKYCTKESILSTQIMSLDNVPYIGSFLYTRILRLQKTFLE